MLAQVRGAFASGRSPSPGPPARRLLAGWGDSIAGHRLRAPPQGFRRQWGRTYQSGHGTQAEQLSPRLFQGLYVRGDRFHIVR